MNIVDFIEARITEDERIAKEASIPAHEGYKPHPELTEWQYVGEEVEYVQTPEMLAHKYAETYYVTCDHEGLLPSVEEDVATHIARHDPARVLRQCTALRAALAAAQDLFEEGYSEADAAEYLTSELAPLAAIWSDHPDYDTTWS